mgnify:CR=1 FL=1
MRDEAKCDECRLNPHSFVRYVAVRHNQCARRRNAPRSSGEMRQPATLPVDRATCDKRKGVTKAWSSKRCGDRKVWQSWGSWGADVGGCRKGSRWPKHHCSARIETPGHPAVAVACLLETMLRRVLRSHPTTLMHRRGSMIATQATVVHVL